MSIKTVATLRELVQKAQQSKLGQSICELGANASLMYPWAITRWHKNLA